LCVIALVLSMPCSSVSKTGSPTPHLASCAVFEGPAPSWKDVSELIAARLPQWRGYRQRLRSGVGHFGRPAWVDHESFDLANHVHHSTLPPPEGELNDLTGRLMSVELDRRRPLWDVWVVDGLAGQRWALIAKIHHCLLDGIAGAELLARLLDVERHPHPTSLRPAGPTATATSNDGRPASSGRHPRRNGAERVETAGVSFGHPRDVARAVRDTVTGALELAQELRPRATLSIHGTIGKQRRWAVARSTLDDLAAVQAVFGGTVNPPGRHHRDRPARRHRHGHA
jgi:WS/DGAT/MGAT family acyltransferase